VTQKKAASTHPKGNDATFIASTLKELVDDVNVNYGNKRTTFLATYHRCELSSGTINWSESGSRHTGQNKS